MLMPPSPEPHPDAGMDPAAAYMNLELSNINDEDVPKLAEALKKNDTVTSLNLSYCLNIEDEGIAALGKGLQRNTSVRRAI
jgi:hypothetical protein